MAIMISFVETTDGNIVQECKRLLQVVISDNAIDNSLETRDTIGDTEGLSGNTDTAFHQL